MLVWVMIVLQAILVVGSFWHESALRRIHKIKTSDFPDVESGQVEAWLRLEIKSRHVFLWPTFLNIVLLFVRIRSEGFREQDLDPLVVILSIILLAGALAWEGVLRSRAAAMKQEYGIVWPKPIPQTPRPATLPPELTGNSKLAILSFVFSLVSPCTAGLLAVPGIILGIRALGQIRRSNGKLKLHGLAMAGTIISSVVFLAAVSAAGISIHVSAVRKHENAMVERAEQLVSERRLEDAADTYLKIGHANDAVALVLENPSMQTSIILDKIANGLRREISKKDTRYSLEASNLISILFVKGDYKGVTAVPTDYPDLVLYESDLLTIAEAHIRLREYKQAVNACPDIPEKLSPGEKAVFQHVAARAYLGNGQLERAEGLLREALQTRTQFPPIVFRTHQSPIFVSHAGARLPKPSNVKSFVLVRCDLGEAQMLADLALAEEKMGNVLAAVDMYRRALAIACWETDIIQTYSPEKRVRFGKSIGFGFLPRRQAGQYALDGLRRLGKTPDMSRDEMVASVWKTVASRGLNQTYDGDGIRIVPKGY